MKKANRKPYSIYMKEKNIRKFNRSLNAIITIVFIGVIFTITIFGIFKNDKEFSEQENRNLSKKPEFTLKSFVNRDFSREYTSYISDQFPGRNIFVAIKGNIDKLVGKNKSNNVYIGKNNQLINNFKEENQEETNEKIKAINDFFEKHKSLSTAFMLVPTASKVLEEKLPKYAPIDDELEYIDKLQDGLNSNIKFINPYKNLYDNRDKYIYYKTDHHWTSKGAYIGYRTMCSELGLIAKDEDYFTIEKVTDSFSGSLSSKIGLESKEADEVEVYFNTNDKVLVNYITEQKKSTSLFDSTALNKKDKYEVFTGGNHPLINIKTLQDPEKKLLIIKDSYANSFLPFLTSHYGEINVVDLRYYADDLEKLINDKEITDVMFLYNVNTFNEDDSILNLNDY